MRDGTRPTRLGSTQQAILELLARAEKNGEHPSQSDIAQQLGVTQQAVNMSLKGLEQRGLVTPVKVTIVPNRLTPEGRKVLKRVERER